MSVTFLIHYIVSAFINIFVLCLHVLHLVTGLCYVLICYRQTFYVLDTDGVLHPTNQAVHDALDVETLPVRVEASFENTRLVCVLNLYLHLFNRLLCFPVRAYV